MYLNTKDLIKNDLDFLIIYYLLSSSWNIKDSKILNFNISNNLQIYTYNFMKLVDFSIEEPNEDDFEGPTIEQIDQEQADKIRRDEALKAALQATKRTEAKQAERIAALEQAEQAEQADRMRRYEAQEAAKQATKIRIQEQKVRIAEQSGRIEQANRIRREIETYKAALIATRKREKEQADRIRREQEAQQANRIRRDEALIATQKSTNKIDISNIYVELDDEKLEDNEDIIDIFIKHNYPNYLDETNNDAKYEFLFENENLDEMIDIFTKNSKYKYETYFYTERKKYFLKKLLFIYHRYQGYLGQILRIVALRDTSISNNVLILFRDSHATCPNIFESQELKKFIQKKKNYF